ncbi:uncharacterized protein DS421_16g559740 [Arachis hypogaea]|nr:uncharacterized protein DS421_16g559740 [Arachis hypogaea]
MARNNVAIAMLMSGVIICSAMYEYNSIVIDEGPLKMFADCHNQCRRKYIQSREKFEECYKKCCIMGCQKHYSGQHDKFNICKSLCLAKY